MNIEELNKSIVHGEIKPFYIFMGEEVGIMDIYIQKIGEILDVKPFRAESIEQVLESLKNKSFLQSSICVVLRDEKEILNANESTWQALKDGEIQGENTIILIFTKLDKRSQFYKFFQHDITEFNKLSAEVLVKHIMKYLELDTRQAIELAILCDCDYSRIMLEIDKIKTFAKVNKLSDKISFQKAREHHLIHEDMQEITFDFIDQVCMRNQSKQILKLLEIIKSTGNILGILSLLYNNFRAMLLVASAGKGDITKKTGLSAWEIKKAKEKGNHYSKQELINNLRKIRQVEKGIKLGYYDTMQALDYLIINIL